MWVVRDCTLKESFYKYCWDEELSALKQAAFDSFKIWSVPGKTKHGNEFEAMKRDKASHKLAIRRKEQNSRSEFSNCLNDALLCKDMGHFWHVWKSKFGNMSQSFVVDGFCDEQSIADTFASVFQSVCQPNSQVHHQ